MTSAKRPKKSISASNGRLEIDFPVIKESTISVLKGAGDLAFSSVTLPKAFAPLARLILSEDAIEQGMLAKELDILFQQLYKHPISDHSRALTDYLRKNKFIPNQQSTENLIGYLVKQVIIRSPVDIPDAVVDEFWNFFQELVESPELKGPFELNLDMIRSILRTYEPLILDIINKIKHVRNINQNTASEILLKVRILRSDVTILKRQIKAIRYIKPFLQTDPKDFKGQALIIAEMVREFGPLFIKMAQVAAATSDFLPDEIAKELAVFQEDVEPMTGQQVRQAFLEELGKDPEDLYFGFDVDKPIKSGSIGSVYLTKKPIKIEGSEVLVPVVVKVARHNLEREFEMGSLAIELMLISSQYWAPHTKLRPFLSAMAEQIKEFTKGFEEELDFSKEAEIQHRFAARAANSLVWHVPRLYSASGRILEMEYLQDAMAINHAIASQFGKSRIKFQRKLAENFLYTMIEHLLIHQEFHGDLHPGNVMVDNEANLYLIDWGNAVDMRGKWGFIGQYILAALSADSDTLADVLIEMSTEPKKNLQRKAEIVQLLNETIEKKQISQLDKKVLWQLYQEGSDGLKRRLQTIAHFMSNAYQLNITIKSDYLHLSRSIVAMTGTYANLYKGISGWAIASDMLKDTVMFPLRFTLNQFRSPAPQVDYERHKKPSSKVIQVVQR
jgi:ubiquinone biosynthesis protein